MAKKKQTGLATLEIDTEEVLNNNKTEQEQIKENRKSVLLRLHPATHKKLRNLSVEEDTTMQALLEHSIDLLFAEKGV